MPIIKHLQTANFVVISNSLAQSRELSYESKGILIDLLSRPENWRINKASFVTSNCGITKINRIFKELRIKKFLVLKDIRKDGKIIDRVWYVSDEPINEGNISKSNEKDAKTLENLRSREAQFENTSFREDQRLQKKDLLQKKEIKQKKETYMSSSTPEETLMLSADADLPVNNLVVEIFEYWKNKFNHPKAKLDGNRKRKIQAMLKLGYSFQDICTAIDGCSVTPHNMGKNKSGCIYDDIELICRDAKHLERFKENALSPPMAYEEEGYVW